MSLAYNIDQDIYYAVVDYPPALRGCHCSLWTHRVLYFELMTPLQAKPSVFFLVSVDAFTFFIELAYTKY